MPLYVLQSLTACPRERARVSTRASVRTRPHAQLIFVRVNLSKSDSPRVEGDSNAMLTLSEFVNTITRMAVERMPHLAEQGIAMQLDGP